MYLLQIAEDRLAEKTEALLNGPTAPSKPKPKAGPKKSEFQMQVEEKKKKASEKVWPEQAQEAFDKEISKLERMNPQAAEYSMQSSYIELLLDLPWDQKSEDNFDLKNAIKVLNSDHYGLEKVKERIVEHLAVLKIKGDLKAPIICLYGPPGVGKTSLGRSIAEALGRKYVRMSLGGLRDEAEIRASSKESAKEKYGNMG